MTGSAEVVDGTAEVTAPTLRDAEVGRIAGEVVFDLFLHADLLFLVLVATGRVEFPYGADVIAALLGRPETEEEEDVATPAAEEVAETMTADEVATDEAEPVVVATEAAPVPAPTTAEPTAVAAGC